MSVTGAAIHQERQFIRTSFAATTDDGFSRCPFFNNTGYDVVITEAWVSGVKGADTYSYMTVNLKDQDDSVISTLAWTAAATATGAPTAMGTCSATHGVIPDGERIYVILDQTNDGDSIADLCFWFNYKLQSPED